MKQRTAGFTFIELLITATVSALTLMVAGSFFATTSKAIQQATFRANEYRDLQGVSSIVGDDVRQAEYIYPSGVTLQLPAPFGTVATGAQTLAMIVPNRNTRCATSYEFVTYHAAARSTFTALDEWLTVPEDQLNATTLVLAEYRACADRSDASATLSSPLMRVIDEYLGTVQFTVAGISESKPTSAQLSLQGQRTLRGRTLLVPAGGPMMLKVFARNIDGNETAQ